METSVHRSRGRLAALLVWCLLLTLAWGLWTWQLDASDLTHDEAISHWLGHRSLGAILTHLTSAAQEHPPVYYLLINSWIRLSGGSEFSLRLFSVAVGLIGLALAGWVHRLLVGSRPRFDALATALVLAATPGMAYYARVARMYTIMVALALLSTGAFVKYWLRSKERPRPMGLIVLAGIHSLAILTHYYMVLPILIQALVLLGLRRWRQFYIWCLTHLVPGSLAILWFVASPGLRMSAKAADLSIEFLSRFQLLNLVGKLLFSPVMRVRFRLLDVILLLVGLGAALAIWKRRAVGVWLGLSLIVPFVVIRALPLGPTPRYVLFVLPSVALALGFLCAAPVHYGPIGRPFLNRGTSAALTVVTAGLLTQGGLLETINFEGSRYGQTLETVKAYARPGDAILFYGPWQAIQLEYYDPGGLPPIVALPEMAPPRLRPAEAEPVLQDLLERYDRLWVLPAAVSDVDPTYFVGSWLHSNAHNVWETGDFGLYLPPLASGVEHDLEDVAFGGVLELLRVAYERQPVPAGEALRVVLTWKPLRLFDRHVRLALSLVDEGGHVWEIARSTPGSWAEPQETWAPERVVTERSGLIVPQGAPPGRYTLRLAAGDAETGASFPVEGEREVDIASVHVTEPVQPPILSRLPNPMSVAFCSPDESACAILAGYEPGGERFPQGYPVPYTLHWRSVEASAQDIQLRLGVAHVPRLPWADAIPVVTATVLSPWSHTTDTVYSGTAPIPQEPLRPVPSLDEPFRVALPLVLRGGGCVTPMPERLFTLHGGLEIPPDALQGSAQVSLSIVGPDGREWLMDDGTTSLPLFKIDIESRPVEKRLPRDLTPVDVGFGDAVALRGYRVQGDARPGGELRMTYAWFARRRPTEIFAVFNHLVTPSGIRVAQADGWPMEGRLLTTQWQPGEYVRDSYTLVIPADAVPGPYTLYVGLYNAATGERQPATQDGQVVPDGRVPIPVADWPGP